MKPTIRGSGDKRKVFCCFYKNLGYCKFLLTSFIGGIMRSYCCFILGFFCLFSFINLSAWEVIDDSEDQQTEQKEEFSSSTSEKEKEPETVSLKPVQDEIDSVKYQERKFGIPISLGFGYGKYKTKGLNDEENYSSFLLKGSIAFEGSLSKYFRLGGGIGMMLGEKFGATFDIYGKPQYMFQKVDLYIKPGIGAFIASDKLYGLNFYVGPGVTWYPFRSFKGFSLEAIYQSFLSWGKGNSYHNFNGLVISIGYVIGW
jgi:hypothetical protein